MLLINLCACKPKPVLQNEIVYRNYSLKQLKNYLQGSWIHDGDSSNKEFNFKYNANSDSIGCIESEQRNDIHSPGFIINKSTATIYTMQIVGYLGLSHDTWAINKISDSELVIQKDTVLQIYKKVSKVK